MVGGVGAEFFDVFMESLSFPKDIVNTSMSNEAVH